MPRNTLGLFCGIFAAVAYGLMPLCTIPLLGKGMTVDTILFYRFTMGSAALAVWMLARRKPFSMAFPVFRTLAVITMFYVMAALSVFAGYALLPGGIATTIHFLYPVGVAILMMLFFNEPRSLRTFAAIALAVAGVTVLSWDDSGRINLPGLAIVVFSAIVLAMFFVGMDWAGQHHPLQGCHISLYVLLISAVPCLVLSVAGGRFRFFPDLEAALILLTLAMLTGMFATLALNYSIQTIGSTMTAIVGATEPMTAVLVGVIVFDEPLTLHVCLGIVLILAAVGCVILAPHRERGGKMKA